MSEDAEYRPDYEDAEYRHHRPHYEALPPGATLLMETLKLLAANGSVTMTITLSTEVES